jgi:4-amino-4-deoxy-L-arabinose transferase-like glycosyltransferase
LVLTGLMARDLGGGRWAMSVAALAMAVAPISVLQGAVFQYVGLDYLWWVLVAFCTIRLLRSGDPRWWLAIGAAVGLGLLTKYTMAFCAAGLVVGVLATDARCYLTSRWLWAGALLSGLIVLPNLLWQAQHGFVSLEVLAAIHARDVAIGRTSGFLVEQLLVCASLFTVPLWIVGVWWYLRSHGGQRYRLLGWLYVVPLVLLLLSQGRSYYLAPAYPMLLAAGAVAVERWLPGLRTVWARLVRGTTMLALAAGGAMGVAFFLPLAPVGSGLWDVTAGLHDTFVEEIGWPELVDTVAAIYATVPVEERPRTAILAGNYGEAGALNLYGPALGLPAAISGVNSHWARGYGAPPPETLIVLGFRREVAESLFERCDLAGRLSNSYGVKNEETKDHSEVFVCRGPRRPWPELWLALRRFG